MNQSDRAGAILRVEKWFPGMTAYVVCSCTLGIVCVLVLDSYFPGKVLASIVLLVLMAATMIYWAKQNFIEDRRLEPLVIMFVALGLFIAAVFAAQPALGALGAVYPVIFTALPIRTACAVAVLISFIPAVVVYLVADGYWLHWEYGLVLTFVAGVTGPTMGVILTRSARISMRLDYLTTELAKSRSEVEQLSREAGVNAERERLALEIHDTLAQGFASIVTLSQAIETEFYERPHTAKQHLRLVISTARESLNEARAMVSELTPAAMWNLSLTAAMERLAMQLEQQTGIKAQVSADPKLPRLSTSVEVVLLRVTQEAISNVRKHSRASKVRIELARSLMGVRLNVVDDGIGLPGSYQPGFGLPGIRTRVAQIGGRVSVHSSPKAGVRIELEVPL
ncbi:sensor histidine kinase [Mycobacteroides chelonae]|nr:sensor histidine kinase [Mycobacteroides chelonae]QQG86590.1 sensor histidine kinase [Mycobacteroides chelonae]QQG91407.1 sensor histidine kinase [Mycobacteroides chelonae]